MATTGNPRQYLGLSGQKRTSNLVTPDWGQMQKLSTAFKRITPAKDYGFESPLDNPSLKTAVETSAQESAPELDYAAMVNSLRGPRTTKQPQELVMGPSGVGGAPANVGDYSSMPSSKETDVSTPSEEGYGAKAVNMALGGTGSLMGIINAPARAVEKGANWLGEKLGFPEMVTNIGSKALGGITSAITSTAAMGNPFIGPVMYASDIATRSENKEYPGTSEGEYNTIGAGGEFSAMGPGMSPAEVQSAIGEASSGEKGFGQFVASEGGAGGAGEGACCFIFIASHGFLHPIVREYRDKHMTTRNRRGYYWLADRLVPWMKKSKTASWLVEWLMVRPMTCYGKYYYNLGRLGAFFAPITKFWLIVFTILGMRPPYQRKGTQEVV